MKALLYSGGLDSACAWYILGKPPALHVGNLHGPARAAAPAEIEAINRQRELDPDFKARARGVAVDFRPFMRPGVWAFQRELLCSLAAWARGYDGVMIAWVAGEGGNEETRQMVRSRYRALIPQPFDVQFPVSHLTKRELVQQALQAGASMPFLLASHSCVNQSGAHCGHCRNCRERAQALEGLS